MNYLQVGKEQVPIQLHANEYSVELNAGHMSLVFFVDSGELQCSVVDVNNSKSLYQSIVPLHGNRMKPRGHGEKLPLSKTQYEILRFIRAFIDTYQYPPSYMEIAQFLRKTEGYVGKAIKAIAKKGYIEYEPYKTRSIRLVE